MGHFPFILPLPKRVYSPITHLSFQLLGDKKISYYAFVNFLPIYFPFLSIDCVLGLLAEQWSLKDAHAWAPYPSHIRCFVNPWTIVLQALLSKGFPKQEYWRGLPFPPPRDLPHTEMEPVSPALQAKSLPLSHQRCSCLVLRICDLQWPEQEGGSRIPTFSPADEFSEEGNGQGDKDFMSSYLLLCKPFRLHSLPAQHMATDC